MNNIKIIKADKLHIPQMAELITQNLGTCNLIKGANNDIMTRNIAELTDTIDYYQVAVDETGTVVGLCGIGEDIRILKDVLGHTKITTTEIYAHASSNAARRTANNVASMIVR